MDGHMNKEAQFRKATFGGFHKEDVLSYIETMQAELLMAREKVSDQEVNVPRMRDKLEQQDVELQMLRVKCRELQEADEAKLRQMLTLMEEKDQMEVKLRKLESECEKVKDVEGQVGSLILDALLYSEKIIARAKEASQIVSDNTKETLRFSAQEVDGIGDDISKISLDFSDTLNSLAKKINTISSDLISVADHIESEDEADEEQFEFDETGYPILRAMKEAKEKTEQNINGRSKAVHSAPPTAEAPPKEPEQSADSRSPVETPQPAAAIPQQAAQEAPPQTEEPMQPKPEPAAPVQPQAEPTQSATPQPVTEQIQPVTTQPRPEPAEEISVRPATLQPEDPPRIERKIQEMDLQALSQAQPEQTEVVLPRPKEPEAEPAEEEKKTEITLDAGFDKPEYEVPPEIDLEEALRFLKEQFPEEEEAKPVPEEKPVQGYPSMSQNRTLEGGGAPNAGPAN